MVTETPAAQAGDRQNFMAGLDFSHSRRALAIADEDFHPVDPAQPHWTETSWWGIASADKGIGGWIYLRARPNLGLIACGIYVFDARRNEMWDAIYQTDYQHVALPAGQSYLGLDLDIGLKVTCERPFERHRIAYRDGDFALDLAFSKVAPPWPVGLGPSTGHFDQAMWATGTIASGDEHFAIDDPAFRDRTWSGRADTAPCPLNFYTWGTTGDRAGTFYAAAGGIIAGRMSRQGEEKPITAVKRSVPQRDASGRPARIVLEIGFADGSAARIEGRTRLTFPVIALPRTLAWSSVVEWSMDGSSFVGEDHEGWSLAHLRENRRKGGDLWSTHL